MIAMNETVDQSCQSLLTAFFKKFPNVELQVKVNQVMKKLTTLKFPMEGKPGGWAGGIIYAVSSIGVGVPGVLNSEFEEAFRVSMGTIYKRAAMITELLSL